MAALTQDRNTKARNGERFQHPMAAGVKIYAGSLVVLDAAGNAKPGVTATGLTAAGRALQQVDNSAGAAGDVDVDVDRGVFAFGSDGSINRTHIGKNAYIVDDQTLAATDGTGTRSVAGIIQDVDGSTVWVKL